MKLAMRHRDIAAIAVTATVAATPALATVVEDVASAPPASAESLVPFGQGCALVSPTGYLNGATGVTTVTTEVAGTLFSKDGGSPCEVPGTLLLQASFDHSHWKTLAQIHGTSWSGVPLEHQCLSGTWWYQGYFVADDGSFSDGTDSAAPTQFTC